VPLTGLSQFEKLDEPGFVAGSGYFGLCGELSGTGSGFLRELGFPLPVLIAPPAPHSLNIIIFFFFVFTILGWYIGSTGEKLIEWT
jgi:hypothetical protein